MAQLPYELNLILILQGRGTVAIELGNCLDSQSYKCLNQNSNSDFVWPSNFVSFPHTLLLQRLQGKSPSISELQFPHCFIKGKLGATILRCLPCQFQEKREDKGAGGRGKGQQKGRRGFVDFLSPYGSTDVHLL